MTDQIEIEDILTILLLFERSDKASRDEEQS
jgi:hypothetical protein